MRHSLSSVKRLAISEGKSFLCYKAVKQRVSVCLSRCSRHECPATVPVPACWQMCSCAHPHPHTGGLALPSTEWQKVSTALLLSLSKKPLFSQLVSKRSHNTNPCMLLAQMMMVVVGISSPPSADRNKAACGHIACALLLQQAKATHGFQLRFKGV